MPLVLFNPLIGLYQRDRVEPIGVKYESSVKPFHFFLSYRKSRTELSQGIESSYFSSRFFTLTNLVYLYLSTLGSLEHS